MQIANHTHALSSLAARLAIVAGSAIASQTAAQSLDGTSFSYETTGLALTNVTGTATVGPGPEFTIDDDNVEYEVDVDATGITVTANFTNPDVGNQNWGVVNGLALGSLTLTWTDLPAPFGFAGAIVSGAGGDDDVFLTTDSVRIGQDTAAGGDNVLRWEPGETLRVDLTTEAVCPWVKNESTGVYYASIAEAITAVSAGDVLELGPCTFHEAGLIREGRSLTLRGHGPDQTVLDGEGRIPLILIAEASTVTIDSIGFFRGSDGSTSPDGAAGAITADNSTIDIRNCRFEQCGAPFDFTSTIAVGGGTRMTIEGSVFRDNFGIASGGISRDVLAWAGASVSLTNCLFDGGDAGRASLAASLYADLAVTNCTFVNGGVNNYIRANDFSTVTLANNVVDGEANLVRLVSDATAETNNNYYPGATGNNVDATPVFVDAANGDFRLASGTPGVDGGDFDAYVAAGGGLLDASGAGRIFDDPNSPNLAALKPAIDAGAFELQASADPAPDPCLADLSGDGVLDLTDINLFTSEFLRGCD